MRKRSRIQEFDLMDLKQGVGIIQVQGSRDRYYGDINFIMGWNLISRNNQFSSLDQQYLEQENKFSEEYIYFGYYKFEKQHQIQIENLQLIDKFPNQLVNQEQQRIIDKCVIVSLFNILFQDLLLQLNMKIQQQIRIKITFEEYAVWFWIKFLSLIHKEQFIERSMYLVLHNIINTYGQSVLYLPNKCAANKDSNLAKILIQLKIAADDHIHRIVTNFQIQIPTSGPLWQIAYQKFRAFILSIYLDIQISNLHLLKYNQSSKLQLIQYIDHKKRQHDGSFYIFGCSNQNLRYFMLNQTLKGKHQIHGKPKLDGFKEVTSRDCNNFKYDYMTYLDQSQFILIRIQNTIKKIQKQSKY
ncbi:hypothetical protein pb186bvf_020656 [Paramecium bursaria]